MTAMMAQQSLEVLAKGSKTFHFASHFLPRDRRADAALLYAFCRLVDDLADEAESTAQAHEDLGQVQEELRGRRAPRPMIDAFVGMADRCGLDLTHAHELMRGVLSDLEEVRVSDDRELMRYSYRVAGTVGLMMCPVLGVEDPEASVFALDLGVAMQLTNICRDVLEDARMGRVYLPRRRLEACGTSPEAILAEDPAADLPVRSVVQDLLRMAERYYRSADRGLAFIPFKPRVAIMVASRVYREIGRKLLRHDCRALAGRTVVSGPNKALVAAGALAQLVRPTVLGLIRHDHDRRLHTPIADLPGAHAAGLLAAGSLE